MKSLHRMSVISCILMAFAAVSFAFPSVLLAGDAEAEPGAFSFLRRDFSGTPRSRFAGMSGGAFSSEYGRLRKELEDSYDACYVGLDDDGRRGLFESEVFWEKYFSSYEKNLCGVLDRPLLIYADGAKNPVITNVYREIVTEILRWRIDDLKRWKQGHYLSKPAMNADDIELKLTAERRRYAALRSDVVLLRYILYHYDRKNMDRISNLFGEKKLEFLENRISDRRTLLCEQLEMIERSNHLLEMISAGLRGIVPVDGNGKES